MTVVHAARSVLGHLLRPLHASGSIIADKSVQEPVDAMDIESPAFAEGQPIPEIYSQDGQNISPPLNWSNVPDGTVEFVLVCEDPDAPMIDPFVHWMVYGLSPSSTSLPEHVPMEPTIQAGGSRAVQSRNSAKSIGYVGPKPPIGHGPHHYHFQLFALSEPSGLDGTPDRATVAEALEGKVLAVGELIGTYERK